jgi:hypothetical protein
VAKEIVSVEVEKSAHSIMQHVAKLVGAYKAAMADGWQVGQDVPALVMAVIAEGPALMSDIQAAGPAFAEDKLSFIKGINVGAYDVAAKFV